MGNGALLDLKCPPRHPRPGSPVARPVCHRALVTITVASGLFAPGHLGELTEHMPFDLVDMVLEETGTVQRRLWLLPSRVGLYFLLALGMFPQVGYLRVWEKLTASLSGLMPG